MPRPDSEPRASRTSLMLGAHVFTATGGASMHRALNLSETGICIAQPEGLAVGERLMLTIGQLETVPAEVVWLRAGLAGLRFLAAVDIAAARRRRTVRTPPAAPAAGWLAALDDAYRAARD